jgi:hypothetical protein
MSKLTKIAAAALTVATLAAAPQAAEASTKHKVLGGLAAGLIVGTMIAGAHAHNRSSYGYTTVYSGGGGCEHLRSRARYNENIGNYGRAAVLWDRFHACRGY